MYDPYLHFCYQLALETSAKYSSIKPLRGHDLCHAHLLASLPWSGGALSGVATQGHAGARAPATRGRAPATRGRALLVQR